MNIGIIICSRVKSGRLPNKAIQYIAGKRSIEHCISFCRRANIQIILAIPGSSDDNILAEIAEQQGIECYRGEDKSPLHRMASVIKKYKLDHVVRVTHDDLLIDAGLLNKQSKLHIKKGADYTFLRRCPEGVATEVIKASALLKIADELKGKDIEFVGYHFRKGGFEVLEYGPAFEFQCKHIAQPYRLTMDWAEDLTVLRILFSHLAQPFSTLDIINFLKKPENEYITKINKLPEVTVYTCAHNAEKYITDCAESVLNQKGVDFEYIVIDDGSSDRTPAIMLERYGNNPKIKLWRNERNRGLPTSCNKALSLARGQWIIRVDADDALVDGALLKMVRYMKSNYDVGGVFSGYFLTNDNLEVVNEVGRNPGHPACCLLDKRAVNEIKYRDGLEHYEGKEFFKRFETRYKMGHIKDALWFYRQHEDQKSKSDLEIREKIECGINEMAPTSTASIL